MNNQTMEYVKPALAFFKERKILMVKDNIHKDVWFLLGGKQEFGETEIEGLKREVQEELSCEIDENTLSFLKEFEDVAYGKEDSKVRIRLYKGVIKGDPTPSNEIIEVGFFNSAIDRKLLTPVSIQIFDWLRISNYID